MVLVIVSVMRVLDTKQYGTCSWQCLESGVTVLEVKL